MCKAKKKVCQYSTEFLKFGFMPAVYDELCRSAYYSILYQQTLTNKSMKSGHLENHLRAKHPNHVNSTMKYFETLNKKFQKRKITSLFATQTATLNRTLEASYKISLFIAKVKRIIQLGNNF